MYISKDINQPTQPNQENSAVVMAERKDKKKSKKEINNTEKLGALIQVLLIRFSS